MTILIRILISVLFLLYFNACIYSNVKAPGPINNTTPFVLTTEDFKILGTVETEGIYKAYFFLVATGGTGYEELYSRAKEMGGDDIINHVFELEGYSIVTFIYNEGKWKARATVIKYTEKAKPKN
ncbi:MAG: hypothetical protein H7A24_08185 [Leptospiraceae bacterium]|nr:hypothetical protein [Leptospiraceae bacterium]MCP5511845.1 hypothetical protein [Leptospiraceae bacterium]